MDILLLVTVGVAGTALYAVVLFKAKRRNAAMNEFAHRITRAKLDDQRSD